MLLATPVGVGVAVWLSEYARPRPLARVVDSTVEMFAGAPSIVLALFGVILFRASFLGFLTERNGGVVYGKGFFPAAAMLSLLALPLVVTSVREGLRAIPNHVREASYAVGQIEDRHDPARTASGGAAGHHHRLDGRRRPRDWRHGDHRVPVG